MRRSRGGWRYEWLLAATLFAAQPAAARIDYAISIAHPDRHIFQVTMQVPKVRDQLTLQMPAWNALYQIRDFSSHMMQVAARDGAGNQLRIAKLDKQTWKVTGNGAVTVSYSTYWDEAGPFSAQLNPDHAFLNLALVLLYVPDRRAEETRLVFDDVPESWRVAVELDAGEMAAGRRTGAYSAPNYDALVDAPVEIGKFEELRFNAGGKPIRVAIHGDLGDTSRVTDALERIVDYESTLMGGLPSREYLFVFHFGSSFGGGGMEHSNSTAISASVLAELVNTSAHEFFHLWNVKRIRPQALEPVDYTKEMYTRSLWFAEGVTDTYAAFTLVRTGLWSAQQFYTDFAAHMNELEGRPAHRWQSAEQSSLDAWLEKYTLYNRPEESISYYNKGKLLGLGLDILIRDSTDNRGSLDDMLRYLNDEYALRGRFYDESQDLRAAAEAVIRKSAPGAKADLRDFFNRYVAGTDEMAYSDWLERAGLLLKPSGQRRAVLGFSLRREGGDSSIVQALEPGSSAEEAGLREGDAVIALNGEAVPRSPERWLRDHQPEEHITLKVRRRGEEKEFSFALGQWGTSYQIIEMPDPAEKQRRIRDGILHGTTSAPR
jgi:predicted metalloprotease with PDZ domain